MYRKGQLILRLDEEKLKINIFKAFKFQNRLDFCIQIDVSDATVTEAFRFDHSQELLEACLVHSHDLQSKEEEAQEHASCLRTCDSLLGKKNSLPVIISNSLTEEEAD